MNTLSEKIGPLSDQIASKHLSDPRSLVADSAKNRAFSFFFNRFYLLSTPDAKVMVLLASELHLEKAVVRPIKARRIEAMKTKTKIKAGIAVWGT